MPNGGATMRSTLLASIAAACRRAKSSRVLAILLLSTAPAFAQIGGHLPADGPFVLDDVEDLDLTADGVERDWIVSFINRLSADSSTSSGLTLAPGQTPIGALHFRGETFYGYIDANFGVPMPGVNGASTLDFPGDISGFRQLTFFACYSPAQNNNVFQVILECYPQNPDSTFPLVYWNYTPALGTTYQQVAIDLYQPSLIQHNPGGLSIGELLSQTRFIAFYMYAGPLVMQFGPTMTLHVDDITLVGESPSATMNWWVYK